jgi:hypothetical protein
MFLGTKSPSCVRKACSNRKLRFGSCGRGTIEAVLKECFHCGTVVKGGAEVKQGNLLKSYSRFLAISGENLVGRILPTRKG